VRTWTADRSFPVRVLISNPAAPGRRLSAVLTLVTLTLLFCSALVAETTTADSQTLDTIEAIGSAPVAVGEIVQSDQSASSQTIDRTVFDRGDIDLGNVLDQQVGIQSRQIGGFGTFASLTVRAATAAQTDVYLDGIRLNSAGN